MLHPQAHDLNNALEKAIVLKADWNPERALELTQRISEQLGLIFEYDDGPPENWVDLLQDRADKPGLVCIEIPLVVLQQSYVTPELEEILASENISFLSFNDWHEEIYCVSPAPLIKVFQKDYNNYPGLEDSNGISMEDFWFMTVT